MGQSSLCAGQPVLTEVVRRVQEISTLPHVALRVMELANNPSAGATELKAVLEQDPALSARVLRCVNSSAYALRQKITNLQHAIGYLGIKQVRNLAVTAAVSDLFRQDDSCGTYRRSELWRHLVSVGVGARLIALRMNFLNFEDMFLAGLLHDIGIILEDQYLHDHFRQALGLLAEGQVFLEAERQCLGFDHTGLGERVAEKWGFPETVRAAIRYHHGSERYRGEHTALVQCVEVANVICTLKGISSVGVKSATFCRAAIDGLSLTREDILALAEALDDELSNSAALLAI